MHSADPLSSASSPGGPVARKPLGLAIWIPWVLVATLVVLCVWLTQLHLTLQAQNAVLRDQQRLAELALRDARQHAEAERILAQREVAELRKQLSDRQ